MGIQDRDYWNEWQREKQGLSQRKHWPPLENRDVVRAKKKGTLVGYLLIFCFFYGLGWVIRLIYRLIQ